MPAIVSLEGLRKALVKASSTEVLPLAARDLWSEIVVSSRRICSNVGQLKIMMLVVTQKSHIAWKDCRLFVTTSDVRYFRLAVICLVVVALALQLTIEPALSDDTATNPVTNLQSKPTLDANGGALPVPDESQTKSTPTTTPVPASQDSIQDSASSSTLAPPVQPSSISSGKEQSTPKDSQPSPPAKDFDAALKLYKAGKYGVAQKDFEKFIKGGMGDGNTHLYLAYCLYNQRQYTKALKEFAWVAKNEHHSISIQRTAEQTAHMIGCYQRGICPENCLKANDPRWQHMKVAGHPDTDLWIKFTYAKGYQAWNQNHIGQVVEYVNGVPTLKGTCPICHGTTRVSPLKDGAGRI